MILLINPWVHDFAAHDFWIKPVGLLQIGALFHKWGYAVDLIDCLDRFHPAVLGKGLTTRGNPDNGTGQLLSAEIPKPEIYRSIPRKYKRYGMPVDLFRELAWDVGNPELILVTSVMTYWYPGVQETIRELRQIYPDTPIVLGGNYARLCPDHAKEVAGADLVVTHVRLKQIILQLKKFLGSDVDVGNVPLEFADYPPPLYALYRDLRSAAIMTSRGCPYKCDFCASHYLWGDYSCRRVDDVVEEIMALDERMNGGDIAFYDDALLYNTDKFIIPVLDKLQQRGFRGRLHAPNGLSPRQINNDLAVLMKTAGFVTVRLSLETAVTKLQHRFSGKITNVEFGDAVQIMHKAGFTPDQVETYVMIGIPGQSLDDMRDTLKFVHDCGSRSILARYALVPFTRDFARETDVHPEYAQEPLLHNNTLAPFRFSDGNFWAFKELEQYSRELNQEL